MQNQAESEKAPWPLSIFAGVRVVDAVRLTSWVTVSLLSATPATLSFDWAVGVGSLDRDGSVSEIKSFRAANRSNN